jgi:peptidyl-prolyl cis-trans isomerase D
MAIITRIRQLSGLVIGAIAVSMLLFIIGGDLLSANSSIMQVFNRESVAEIDGVSISPREFADQVTVTSKEMEILQLGRPPGESEMEYVRYTALNELLYKLAFQKEFDKLGIRVTPEEMEDMIQGNNIDPNFARQFMDQQTGEIDRNQIVAFLKQLPQLPAQSQEYFRFLEGYIAKTRLRKKYNDLLALSNYASKAEAKAYHEEVNSKRNVRYLYVPYNSIPDSAVKVDDAGLQAFFSQNKEKYKRKENRAIEYVSFPLKPSAKDTASTRKELEELKPQLQTAEDAKSFADANSDVPNAVTYFKPGELPQVLMPLADSLKTGVVLGPFLTNGTYAIYRVVDTNDDSTYSAKASHILFSADKNGPDSLKQRAKKDAERILGELQRGADFAMMAGSYSGDQSNKYQGGDLGWFGEKAMVEPFAKAVMGTAREGLVPYVVETEFGYHLIKVTGAKTKKRFNIAAIARTIAVSDETRAQAYSAAGAFATAKTAAEYVEKVKAAKMVSLQALTIPRDAKNINNLSGSKVREVVRWVYNEATLGDVSRVFELDDQYIVAISRDPATEEGEATLNDVKEEVLAAYRKELKGKQIMEKLGKLSGSLDEIKKGYGDKAELIDQVEVNINTSGLNIAGYAPTAIGYMFAMNKGEKSKPFKDEQGVFILEVSSVDAASEVADYNSQKDALADRRKAQIEDKVLKAMRKLTNLKDNIAKYY